MRKVELNLKENQQYKVIKKLVETNGNKKRAAIKLNCTQRHINRLIKKYKEKGKAGFLHGNTGRQPPIKSIKKKELRFLIFTVKKYPMQISGTLQNY